MAARRGKIYFPLDSLFFDQDTTSVFLDQYGHLTEQANAIVANRIVDLLVPLLRPVSSR